METDNKNNSLIQRYQKKIESDSDDDSAGKHHHRLCTYMQFQLHSIQLGFNMHINRKPLQHTPVLGTHSSYELGCLSRTVG